MMMRIGGMTDVAEVCGVTRRRVYQWKDDKPGFPERVADPAAGDVYDLVSVAQWCLREKVGDQQRIRAYLRGGG